MHYTKYIVIALLLHTLNVIGAAQGAAAAAAVLGTDHPLRSQAQAGAKKGPLPDDIAEKLKATDAHKKSSVLENTATTFDIGSLNQQLYCLGIHVDHVTTKASLREKFAGGVAKNLENIDRYLTDFWSELLAVQKAAQSKSAQLKAQHADQSEHNVKQQVYQTGQGDNPEGFSSSASCQYLRVRKDRIKGTAQSIEQGSSYMTLGRLQETERLCSLVLGKIPAAQKVIQSEQKKAQNVLLLKRQTIAKAGSAATASSSAVTNTSSVGATPTLVNTPLPNEKVAAAAAAAAGSAPQLPPLPKRPNVSASASSYASSTTSTGASMSSAVQNDAAQQT